MILDIFNLTIAIQIYFIFFKNLLNSLVKSPAVPPVNAWFMAGAGGKIIGRGPGRFMNFGRGREGPGRAGGCNFGWGRGRGPGRALTIQYYIVQTIYIVLL